MDNSKSPATKADIQALREDMLNWKQQLQDDMLANREGCDPKKLLCLAGIMLS